WVIMWLLGTGGARAEEMSAQTQKESVAPAIPFRDIFLLRTFWITCAVGVTVNMSWHFYRVWLPRHLVVDLRFTDQQLQYLLIAFYLAADVGSITIGWIARKLARAGRSVERSRKIVIMIAALICLMATPVVFSPGRMVMVPLYCCV